MQYALIFLLLLSFIFGLGLIARRINVPYPILFVIGGLFIGFIPILPYKLVLDPELIFFVFLPPLLYIQAFYTSWRDFRENIRPILMLAIGLVFVTTVAVGLVSHWMIGNQPGLPYFPLAAGAVLGAIISPPDAIAAAAIAQRLGLPRRIVTILEGESLVNDATSLVIFKIALAAVGATVPLMGKAWLPGEFLYVAIGGVAVGLLVGKLIGWVRRRIIDDGPMISLCVSLMTPYISYLLADQFLHVSGVLSVVTSGMYLGWEAPEVMNSAIRLQAKATWDMVIYVFNGMIFVLIGLQLPGILASMHEHWWPRPFFQAIVINLLCIAVRFLWIFPTAQLPFLAKDPRVAEKLRDPRALTIVSWCGMRGVVSLAAALTLEGYPNFPRPHLVQFIAFSVIFSSLVVQGLTLPALIRWLGVADDGVPQREENQARKHLAKAVFSKLDELRDEGKFPDSALMIVERTHAERALIFDDPLVDQIGLDETRHHVLSVRRLSRIVIATQRRALVNLRRSGLIGDDILHKIEHELDLEESRVRTE